MDVAVPSATTITSENQDAAENWAKFDSIEKGEKDSNKNTDGWADFSSFDKMSDSNEQRSSSPVSMETETSRPSAYGNYLLFYVVLL